MKILSAQESKNYTTEFSPMMGREASLLLERYKENLVNINTDFTNNVVYKIMKIVDNKTLFEIKDKARNFQNNIFEIIRLFSQLTNKYLLLYREISNIYLPQNGQLCLFADIDQSKLTELSELEKLLTKMYYDIQIKLSYYKNFVNKKVIFANTVQEQYRIEKSNKYMHIVDEFKNLNNSSLLSYIKQYERLVNKFKIAEEKANTMFFSNGEEELIINLDVMKLKLIYETAGEKLKSFDKLHENIFDGDIKDFKKYVVDFSKKINDFNNKLNMIEKTRE